MIELLAQYSHDSSGAAVAALAAAGLAYAVFICALVAFYVLIAYMIVKKAGYNPWLSLLILVPAVNFIMLIIFAFSEWPIQRQLREQRARAGIPPGAYPEPSAPYGSQTGLPPTGIPPATT